MILLNVAGPDREDQLSPDNGVWEDSEQDEGGLVLGSGLDNAINLL